MKQLSSIAITLLLMIVLKGSSLPMNRMRLLTAKDEACANIPKGYKPITEFGSLNAYVESLNLRASGSEDFLMDLLSNGSLEKLMNLILDVIVYLIMLVFGIVTIIMWPTMCCCCCCSCCVFNKNKKKKGICALINWIVTVSLFSIVIASSICGLAFSTGLVQYFNGSVCSLLTLLDNAITGEKVDTVPRWGGAKGIGELLEKSKTGLTEISGKVFSPLFTTTQYDNDFKKLIETKKPEITNPENDAVKLIPIYSFFPETNQNYILINSEKEVVVTIKQLLLNLQESIHSFQSVDLSQSLDPMIQLVNAFDELLESVSNSLGSTIVNIQTIVANVIILIFQILYGLFLALSIGSITIFVLYSCLNCYCLKIMIHIFWNLIFLMIAISFILGCVLGLLAVIGGQITPVVNKMFTPEFLKDMFGSGAGDYLNTCINKDGNLIVDMIPKEDQQSEMIPQLLQYSIEIEKYKNTISGNKQSKVWPDLIKQFTNYKDDIYSTSPIYKQVIEEINNGLKKDCREDKRFYIEKQSRTGSETEIPPTGPQPDFPSSCASFKKIFQNTFESVQANDQLLIKYNNDMDDVNNKFGALMNCFIIDLEEASKLTNSLATATGDLLEGQSFSDMLNCNFIKYGMISFVDQFGNKFASQCLSTCICCLICAFFGLIGVFFLINAMSYYSKEVKEKDENEQEKPPKADEQFDIQSNNALAGNPINPIPVDVVSNIL